MPQEYLALLDSAAQQGRAVHQQIAQQLDRSLAIQRENSQFEVETTFKGLQFAEQQRKNDADIFEAQVLNGLRAQEMDLKMRELRLREEEQPLIRETRLLQLQAAKDERKARMEAIKAGQFDKTAGIFDDQMGMFLIGTESTDAAKEYYELKAGWRNRVANGEAFDSDAYSRSMQEIMGKYKDAKPSGVWSPESQMIFDSVSPSLGRNYQLKNPVVGRNANSIAGGVISSDSKVFNETMSQFGSLWSDEYRGLLGAARTSYEQNNLILRQAHDELMRLESGRKSIMPDDEKGLSHYKNETERLRTVYKEAADRNQKIMQDAMSGKLDYIEPPKETLEPPKYPGAPDPDKPINPEESKVFGQEGGKDYVYQEVNRKLKEVRNIIDKDGKHGIGNSLDLSWFSDNLTGEVDYDTVLNIRNSIERDLDGIEDIDDQFTADHVNSLLKNLKTTQSIPIDPLLGGTLKETPLTTITTGLRTTAGWVNEDLFGRGDYEYELRFGGDSSVMSKVAQGGNIISSMDDIQKLIAPIKSKEVRDLAKRDIYAALISANLKQSLTTK